MGVLNFFRQIKSKIDSYRKNEFRNTKSDIESIISKFRAVDIERHVLLKEQEALPLLELLHQLNDKDLEVLKREVGKWTIHERQTFLNVIGFEKTTPEERFKYYEKEMFPGYWHSKSTNKFVLELYQYIFRYSLLVFNPVPIHKSDIINELLNHMSDKDWKALKIDLPFWSSYQNTFFLNILNNHSISNKYSTLECFRALFPDNWKSQTSNLAVASAYRIITESERNDTDYWWDGHGSRELLKVVENLFQEKDWQELEEDFKYWTDFQLECFMEAIVAETYANPETQEVYQNLGIKLYHMILPILKICNKRQSSYNEPARVLADDNFCFFLIHFDAFSKEDFSIVKKTKEILILLGSKNGEIWEKVNSFKE